MLFSLKTATCSCNYEKRTAFFEKQKVVITKEGKLPICISENSGLIKAWQDGYYWTHNDGGGSPELYMINKAGDVFDTLEVNNAVNVDWEDLAKDNKGNIYVGDFGNNNSTRKDLTIYKKSYNLTEKITFRFKDQNFDNLKNKIFDCEAFFWSNDSLYLFTKSWNKGKKISKMYVLPDVPGDYELNSKDKITLKTQVTGADISPSKDKFALITYGKILIFKIENQTISFKKPLKCIKIAKNQTEAIVFENDSTLVFSNEQRKLYSIKI